MPGCFFLLSRQRAVPRHGRSPPSKRSSGVGGRSPLLRRANAAVGTRDPSHPRLPNPTTGPQLSHLRAKGRLNSGMVDAIDALVGALLGQTHRSCTRADATAKHTVECMVNEWRFDVLNGPSFAASRSVQRASQPHGLFTAGSHRQLPWRTFVRAHLSAQMCACKSAGRIRSSSRSKHAAARRCRKAVNARVARPPSARDRRS